jgi:hypothetical protein
MEAKEQQPQPLWDVRPVAPQLERRVETLTFGRQVSRLLRACPCLVCGRPHHLPAVDSAR